MKRPTEAKAARIEAKIERLRADATKEFFDGRYGRHRALTIEADALEREYHAACGVFGVVRRQLLGSLDREESQ